MAVETKVFNNSKFKWLRNYFDLSQKQFAEKLNTTQQTITLIENNKRDVPKSVRINFHKAYDVSYEDAIQCETEEELSNLLKYKINPKNSEIYNKQITELRSIYDKLDFLRQKYIDEQKNVKAKQLFLFNSDNQLIAQEDILTRANQHVQILDSIIKNYDTFPDSLKEALNENVNKHILNAAKYNAETENCNQEAKDDCSSKNLNNGEDNIVALPLHRIGAAAGAGTWLSDEPEVEKMYFDKRFLEQIVRTSNYNSLHLVYATGNSMDSGWNQPDDIKDGDLLMIDTSQTTGNNNIFVIKENNTQLRVKRLFKKDNALYISSNNPAYQTEVYYPDNCEKTIEVIGKVVWHGSKDCSSST